MSLIVPVGKTTPLSCALNKDLPPLVRVGTVGDGSCFFHAIMHAISSDYREAETTEKQEMVKRLRGTVASKFKFQRWIELPTAWVAFQELFHEVLEQFYRVMRGTATEKDLMGKQLAQECIGTAEILKECQLVTILLDMEDMEQRVLPQVFADTNLDTLHERLVNTMDELLQGYLKEVPNVTPLRQIGFRILLGSIVKEAVTISQITAFKRFQHSLASPEMHIDLYTIDIIADILNLDVYFIDVKTSMPYRDGRECTHAKRKSIVMAWTMNCHYELITRMEPTQTDDGQDAVRVGYMFAPTDPLINRLHTYLYHPERYTTLFPDVRVDPKSHVFLAQRALSAASDLVDQGKYATPPSTLKLEELPRIYCEPDSLP